MGCGRVHFTVEFTAYPVSPDLTHPFHCSMSQSAPVPPTPNAPLNPTLEDAWKRFGEYDKNASLAQTRFTSRRRWLTIMGVAVTTMAVLHSTLLAIVRQVKCSPFPGISWDFSQLETWRIIDMFEVGIILIPIITTVIYAGDVKSNMGLAWIIFRSTAETLKKEIYLYRMQVKEYAPTQFSREESRDIQLAKRIKILGQRVMETQVNQTGIEPYQGKLPPYGPEGDDGFSDMVAEDYLAWRLEDQFNYYRKKAFRLSRQLSTFQWSVYAMGGVGIFMASVQQEIWVAVTSSMAAAFTSFLEFNRVESTLISCNQAASDLYNIRTWWRALSPEAKADLKTIELLVENVENVIQAENAGWVQEMRDALTEVYGDQDSGDHAGGMNIGDLDPSLEARFKNAQAIAGALDGSIESVFAGPRPSQASTPRPQAQPQAGANATDLGSFPAVGLGSGISEHEVSSPGVSGSGVSGPVASSVAPAPPHSSAPASDSLGDSARVSPIAASLLLSTLSTDGVPPSGPSVPAPDLTVSEGSSSAWTHGGNPEAAPEVVSDADPEVDRQKEH